ASSSSHATSAGSARARSRSTWRPRSIVSSVTWRGDLAPLSGIGCALMADERRFDLEDVLLRPGCYLNPQTEIMVVVDDSPSIDGEIFNLEEFEGADWVLIADEVPVDEARRDEL